MSQSAVLSVCQRPVRFGLPFVSRGSRGAAAWPKTAIALRKKTAGKGGAGIQPADAFFIMLLKLITLNRDPVRSAGDSAVQNLSFH